MNRSWWHVLGVPHDADEVHVKRAYRALAQQHHPDHGGSDERMKELNTAYDAAREALAAREAERRHIANPFRQYRPSSRDSVDTHYEQERVAEADGRHAEAVVRVTSYKPSDEERRRQELVTILAG